VGLVFVNYRKNERTLVPAAIYRELVAHFGVDQVFQDYVSLRPGQMYPAGLRQALARANILITVIGPDWLMMTDEHGVRLLDRTEDWVRYEISVALARGITVVPVLTNGARHLEAARLPEDIRQLAQAQAVEIHDRNLGKGLADLVAECQAAGVLRRATPDVSAPRAQPPRWRSRVLVAAVAVIVVGVALALTRPWEGRDGDGAEVTPSTDLTAPETDRTETETTAPEVVSGAVVSDDSISFESATDLDQIPPPNGTQGGPWGMDIYFPTPTRLEPGPEAAVIRWEEESEPTRAGCANSLAGAVEEKPVVALKPGDRVCVRTDNDEVAYVKFTGLSADGLYIFHAIVWES
jgi:hypothetical protein